MNLSLEIMKFNRLYIYFAKHHNSKFPYIDSGNFSHWCERRKYFYTLLPAGLVKTYFKQFKNMLNCRFKYILNMFFYNIV